MTEMNLKPCPFCGGEANFNSDEFGEGVCCKSCGATLSNGVYGEEGRKLASADWNSRTIEYELREKIEKLEAENARLLEALEKARYYLSKVDCYRENIADEADYFWKVKINEALKGESK